ncbi:hypothetical protein Chor_002181 [Crotalus horridus]
MALCYLLSLHIPGSQQLLCRIGKLHVSSHRNLQYGWTAYILGDKASAKFTEYSKVFTVDGNLHAGTAKLAQQVAEILGQGVVLERSPYSDFVFLEAMSKQNYIHPRCVKHYYTMKHLSICEILPPHLVLYIDVPVSEVKKRIDKIGEPYEKNVSTAYLQSIEDTYKKSFLPQMSETSEILQYTASELDSMERIIEDIEMLKFDKGPWLVQDDLTLHYLRCCVNDKSKLLSPLMVPDYIPEVTVGGLDADAIYHSYRELPGRMFAPGYNADVGDKWIWLK